MWKTGWKRKTPVSFMRVCAATLSRALFSWLSRTNTRGPVTGVKGTAAWNLGCNTQHSNLQDSYRRFKDFRNRCAESTGSQRPDTTYIVSLSQSGSQHSPAVIKDILPIGVELQVHRHAGEQLVGALRSNQDVLRKPPLFFDLCQHARITQ